MDKAIKERFEQVLDWLQGPDMVDLTESATDDLMTAVECLQRVASTLDAVS